VADELILSQLDQLQIHRVSQAGVIQSDTDDFLHDDLSLSFLRDTC